MRKIALLVALPLFALLAVALLPFWLGGEIEKQLRLQSEQFQQQWGSLPGISYELSRYQRGYLSSVVDTRVTISPQSIYPLAVSDSSLVETFTLTFRHKVSHGPWIDNRFSLSLMSKIETLLLPVDGQDTSAAFYFSEPAAVMTSWLEWSGGIWGNGAIPAYRGRDHTGQYDVKWGGFHFSFEGDWLSRQVKGHFNAPRFELVNAAYGVTIGGLFGNFNHLASPQFSLLGNGEVNLNLFKLRAEGEEGVPLSFILRDMGIVHHELQRGAVMDVVQEFEFRLLQINDVKLDNGALHLSLNNLDVAILKMIQQRYASLGPVQRADPKALQQALLPLLSELLMQAPFIDVNKVEVATVDGVMSGRFKLGIDEGVDVLSTIQLPEGLVRLLSLAQIEIEIKLPAPMIEQQARKAVHAKIIEQLLESEQTMTAEKMTKQTARAVEQMLAQFEIQNILRREANHYRAKLRYQSGHLYLNGVPADNFLSLLPSLKES
ncbi:hypothetical protein MNBD_GAMMA17-489 [hydrothermal vent metagenome]|uniref:DUF945 family protein n=1 Tax=hydrothermal vent metagenome TaxID=652676 RepID=A0A3B0ZP95_9ZZZZ